MSYDTIKAGLIARLRGLGYQESPSIDVEDMSSNEYANTFIVRPLSGENDEDTSETISSLVYDIQRWHVLIVFPRSSENQVVMSDEVQRRREALINELDDPATWSSYARIQKYKTWTVEDKGSYFLLTIELKIIDTITY